MANNNQSTLLSVTDLQVSFPSEQGMVRAVKGVSFSIQKGETLGLVGESGSGKSVTSLAILRLLQGAKVEGKLVFDGQALSDLDPKQLRNLRGDRIAMIFQEPMTSLNPVFTIGHQIGEALRIHRHLGCKETRKRVIELLTLVGIPRPEAVYHDYPHKLSGGMRQRVMIAMAMSCDPELLIADEPTTALDVTIQAQILELMHSLRDQKNTAILLITHDLGVVAEMCNRVAVMYAGNIVETSSVQTLFDHPLHPYTQGLLKAMPTLETDTRRLYTIPGTVPAPGTIVQGCLFAPRCPFALEKCQVDTPVLTSREPNHEVSCWLQETPSSSLNTQEALQ